MREWLRRMVGTTDPPERIVIDKTVPQSEKKAPVRITWPRDKKSEKR